MVIVSTATLTESAEFVQCDNGHDNPPHNFNNGVTVIGAQASEALAYPADISGPLGRNVPPSRRHAVCGTEENV
jgi:hypothetical protein